MSWTGRGLILAFILFMAGCQSATFVEKYGSIEPGLSRAEVTSLLGDPAEVDQSNLPEGAFFGPAAAARGSGTV